MDFTLENAVSIYYASLEHQLAYWNLYLVVAFAFLAYLGANRTQASLIKLCIVIFVVFSVSNLIVVSKLQAHLVTVSNGITTYVEASSSFGIKRLTCAMIIVEEVYSPDSAVSPEIHQPVWLSLMFSYH